ncbi:MAG: type IX secretion system membrane protein PorP/SprF [Muribaculaceae bacterium]|nr:type IX secretion system membrane protein PorP/SprF [Muribaculaceae bacterium]
MALKQIRHITLALTLVMAAFSATRTHAQVDAQLSHYWAVPAYYNPAATGNIDFIHISVGSRLQWLGIRHAPMSFHGMADMPFKFLNRRWGVGLNVESESMGLYRSFTGVGQLSWKKNMLGGTLSVGVQAGLLNETFKGSRIEMPETDDAHTSADDAIPQTDVTGNAFDLGAGIYFSHKKWWVGASVTHINQPTVSLKTEGNEEDIYEFEAGRAYYLAGGCNIPIKNTLFELQPSFFVKTDFQFYQAEVTARVRYNKFLSGGVAYRYNDAIVAMLGAELKNFFVGYAYEYPMSAINKATKGSHELFVTYNIKLDMGEKNKNKHRSIRIM